MTVRERLWQLMALDNIVEEREQQIVDQDADSGEWGLTSQVSTSARGRIPDDTQKLLQRAEEERVRLALDQGCNRDTVADVMGVVKRTIRHKEKRARAYDFPLEALESSRGQPQTTDDTRTEQAAAASDGTANTEHNDRKNQQQLNDVSTEPDAESDGAVRASETAVTTEMTADGGNHTDPEAHIKQAIDALEALRTVI